MAEFKDKRIWDGPLNPQVARTIATGVSSWIEEGKPQVSAAERLRRIRAMQAGTQIALKVWSAQPARSSRVWMRWSLVAAAIFLAFACLAYFLPPRSSQQKAIQPEREETPEPRKESRVANAPLLAGTIQAGAHGLFGRELGNAKQPWKLLEVGAACGGNTLVQAALQTGGGELKLFDQHRVKLSPGTLVRLGNDPLHPWIDLWRGKMEIWAGAAALQIGTKSPLGAGQRKDATKDEAAGGGGELQAIGGARTGILSLEAGGFAAIETAAFEPRTFELGGFTLIDEDSLVPLACHFPGAIEPPPVKIQEGTANLLRVIPCDYSDKPVEDIAGLIGTALDLRVRLSEQARKQAGKKSITLAKGQVTGAEALAALAEKASLVVQIRDGEVVLELPGEGKETPASPDEVF